MTMLPPLLTHDPEEIQNDGQPKPVRLVVAGPPGTGKTTLLLSFPRPLVINTDVGLEGDALHALEDAGGLEWTFEKGEGARDLTALYFWIRDHSEGIDTIGIDSLPELCRVLLDEIVDQGKGAKSGSSSGVFGQTFFDVVPEQGEYLAGQRQLHRFLDDLRKLGKHIVVTGGVRSKPGKRETIDLSPGYVQIVSHWASVIGYLVVDQVPNSNDDTQHRILVTNPGSAHFEAKSRYAVLTPWVIEPTFDKLWTPIVESSNGKATHGPVG